MPESDLTEWTGLKFVLLPILNSDILVRIWSISDLNVRFMHPQLRVSTFAQGVVVL